MDKLILINKEKGVTSREVCDKVKTIFKESKIGHFGTLDPMATGLLVIAFGSLTKVLSLLSDKTKEYEVEVLIGKSTDTYDITGNIVSESNSVLKEEDLIEILNTYVVTYMQEVPIYSAVKVNGKKLYEYARKNEKVDLPKKEVTIFSINDIKMYSKSGSNYFSFKTHVSSGTYIRSLINDISKSIGIPMCMSNLNRTKCCSFSLKDSYTLEDLRNGNYKLLDITDILDLDIKEIPKELENSILNGNKINKISTKKILFQKNGVNISIYDVYNDSMKPILTFKK